MPRQRHRSIETPPFQDEPNWKEMTKADAIREASKLLGCEKSPIKVVRFLEHHDIQVSSPQAVKVLGDMYRNQTPESLVSSVQAVIAVQKYAGEHGGMKALAKKMDEVKSLIALADSIGGFEVLRSIVQQLQAAN